MRTNCTGAPRPRRKRVRPSRNAPFWNPGRHPMLGAILRPPPIPNPLGRADSCRPTSIMDASRHLCHRAHARRGGTIASMSVLVAYCTCPDADSAARVARALVDERLAACVTRLPGTRSCYRWEGKVEEATEELLMIKTTAARLEALERRLRELHPYDVPEFLTVPAGGSRAYLDWVADMTGAPSP